MALERDITPDTELGWEGVARMAERARDAGVELTPLQTEALRRYPEPRSSFQSLEPGEWDAHARLLRDREDAKRMAAGLPPLPR